MLALLCPVTLGPRIRSYDFLLPPGGAVKEVEYLDIVAFRADHVQEQGLFKVMLGVFFFLSSFFWLQNRILGGAVETLDH